MSGCCRLQELLLGAQADQVPLTTGILEIISTVELAVTAVYTREDGAIDVRPIPAQRL